MDVQKVSAQAAAAQQSGQRKDDGAPKSLASFVDMIRNPSALLAPELDPFAAHEQASAQSTQDLPDQNSRRDDFNEQDDYRPEASRERDEPEDDHAPKRADDDRDVAARNDDAPRDDNNTQTADDGNDQADTGTDGNDNADSGQQAASDDGDQDTGSTDNADTKPVNDDKGQQVTADRSNGDGALAPALDNLRQATQTNDGDVIKTAAQTVAAAAQTNGAAGGNGNPQAQQAVQQQANQFNPNAAQQTGEAGERIGTQAADGRANANQNANANQQTLADQQAQSLAAQLKSDKPVKVNVNVNDRGAANANAATQSTAQGDAQRTDLAQTLSTKPSAAAQNGQARAEGAVSAEARAEQAAIAQNQAQAQAQAAKGVESAALKAGLARAAAQVAASAPQASGGVEGVNSAAQATNQPQQPSDVQRTTQPQAAQQSTPTRPVVQQISVNITKAVADGLDRINIHLRPEELGRVEVKLEVGKNGKVNAQIIADRPETLELLRNESRNLEKALQEAGFDTGSGDLSFDLRQQEQNGDGEKTGVAGKGTDDGDNGDAETQLAHMIMNGEPLSIISKDRVDIRA